jgi:hypothetical protein
MFCRMASLVGIDRARVLRFSTLFGFGGSGENRTDHFFAKQHECRNGAKSLWWDRVPPGFADASNEAFAAELFQIVRPRGGRHTRWRSAGSSGPEQRDHPHLKPVAEQTKESVASRTVRMRAWLIFAPPTRVLPT